MTNLSIQLGLSTEQVAPSDEKLVTAPVHEDEETHGKA